MTRPPQRAEKRALLVVVLAVVGIVLAACGVPSSGKPVLDGPPTTKNSAAGSGGVVIPPTPSGYTINDVSSYFTTGYFDAVAGQVGPKQKDAANEFMTPELRKTWKTPSPNITVIRVKDVFPTPTGDGYTVNVHVVEVGIFDPQTGSLLPPSLSPPTTLTFRITIEGSVMLLSQAPDGMYMNEDALHDGQYFDEQIIYYWDQNHGLIPDLRYQSASLTSIQRATAVVKWILAGPPANSALAGIATPVPSGVQLLDNTLPTSGNTFVVHLNSVARALQPDAQKDLLTQIRWSLGSIRVADDESAASGVQLSIPNQTSRTDSDPTTYVTKNQAALRATAPAAYAIAGGKVRPLIEEKGTTIPVLPDGAPNTHVVLAAIDSGLTAADSVPDRAAFVRTAGGTESLWVRRGTKTVGPIRLSSSTTAATFARPVWLASPVGALAFVADGNFYVLPADKDVAVRVAVPSNIGPVDAFSVAPDGRQVALIAKGQLWTSLLETGGGTSASSLTSPRLLPVAPALTTVTTVAWSAVDEMIVGGSNSTGWSTIEVFMDGTYTNHQPQLKSFGNLAISQVVSYPLSANVQVAGSPDVMVQTNSFACGGRASCPLLKWQPPSTTLPAPTSPFYPD